MSEKMICTRFFLVVVIIAVVSAFEIGQKTFSITDCILTVRNNNNASYDLLWAQENSRVRVSEVSNVFFSPCPENPHANCSGSSLCFIGASCKAFFDIKDATIRNEDGHLQIIYEATSRLGCGDGKKTAELIYLCSDDSLVYSEVEDEVVKIIWKSPAGCPLNEDFSVKNQCWFNSRDLMYDLRSLQNLNRGLTTPYGDNKELVLNLCGGLSCPDRAALCEKDLSTGRVTAVTSGLPFNLNVHRMDQLSLRGQASLKFDSPGNQLEVSLYCDQNLNMPVITAVEKNDSTNSIVINVNTTSACPIAISQPCEYEFNRGTYDLSPLRSLKNRRVETVDGGIILLNICQSLNYEPDFSCTGGNVIGCFKHLNQSVVLGNRMEINETSSGLELVLMGGSCSNNFNVTTHVDLICSNVEKEPTLRKYELCDIHIEWYSSAGCPTRFSRATSECVISHPFIKDAKLNLTRLFNRGTVHVYVPPLRSTFRMSLCSPLDSPCGMANNVSICMIATDDVNIPVPVGYSPVELVASNSGIQFKSVGAPCRPDFVMSQTIVNVKCHFETADRLKFISEDRCHVIIDLYTNHACPYERNPVPCSIFDEKTDLFYDISPLALTSQNHVARINDTAHLEFNLCQNVIPAGCDKETDACLVDKTNPLKPSYREVGFENVRRMTIANQSVILSLEYSNECDYYRYSTILNMTCGPKPTNPMVELRNCTFYVQLTAPEVCPITIPRHPGCKNDLFDLTSLATEEWSTPDKNFKLSVCGPLANLKNTSSKGASVLLNAQPESKTYGFPNSPLLFDNQTGMPFLNYTTGVQRIYSLIYFMCSEKNGPANYLPTYYPSHPSTHYTFSFESPRACKYTNENSCCPDVPGLCSRTGNFYLKANGVRVILGVCASLTPCNGSLACTPNLSLGRFLKGPTTDSDGTVTLVYTKGDTCKKNKSEDMSTVLQLKCSTLAKQGEPTFVEIRGECRYVFMWESHLFCPQAPSNNSSHSIVTSDCLTVEKEPRLGRILNLNQLDYELSSKNGFRYTIDLCSPRESVHDSCSRSLCVIHGDGSRTPTGHRFDSVESSDDNVVISYSSQNKTCKCTVKFLCNLKSYLGKPKIVHESDCDLDIVWETQLLCPSIPFPASSSKHLKHFNFAGLLWTSMGVLAVIVVVALATIIYRKRRRNYARLNGFGGVSSEADLLSESSEVINIAGALKLE